MRYHRTLIVVYASLAALNGAGVIVGVLGHNSVAALNALFAVWFCLLIVGQGRSLRYIQRMDYFTQIMGIAHRRNVWAKEIARLEQNIYGETYDHDRSYLPGQEKRS